MSYDQCCDNPPIALVTYEDFNNDQPVRVCRKHWNLKNEKGYKHWQKWTTNIEFLEMEDVK